MLQQAFRRSGIEHLATLGARSRPHVDDIIRLQDRLPVMFDNDEGIALIAKLTEVVEKALMVTGVKADAGFIEDVEDAGKRCAELMSQAHALYFAASEANGGAIQGKVGKPKIFQAFQAMKDFTDCLRSQLFLGSRQRQVNQPLL
jgi:hypothetical protein